MTTTLRPAPSAPSSTGVVARHVVRTFGSDFSLCIVAPDGTVRRAIGEALADAVGELRAADITLSPLRRDSLVSRLRRGEITADAYAPLAEIVARCAEMRAATDGWFDAWAVPGGFDPSGLVKGWAIDRAAARLRSRGFVDYAISTGADALVRGRGPHGGPWRVALHDPVEPWRTRSVLVLTGDAVATSRSAGAAPGLRRAEIINPHTGEPANGELTAATVVGPDLATADAYATALCAAGLPALAWFPTTDGYRALPPSVRLLH